MKLSAQRCYLLAAVLASGSILHGQDTPTFSVNVKVVNVLATVRDKKSRIINDLSQNDFTLEEDGRPQAIKYFTRETDLPLTLGLLVDTSFSQRNVLEEERSASGTFVDEVMRVDKDRAFLIHFDQEVELLQDVTDSPQKIHDGLSVVGMPEDYPASGRGSGYPGGPGGHGRGVSAGGTLLYDSVYLASGELMDKQKGRKALIILTDGIDHGSKVSMERAIESAQRADTLVYTIWFTGDESGGSVWGSRRGGGGAGRGGHWPGGGWPGGGGGSANDGKKILKRISVETGGRMFEVSKNQNIAAIYQQIQDELRNQYNIGYTPGKLEGPDYRRIVLKTKRNDLLVQAREGYYASKPDKSGD